MRTVIKKFMMEIQTYYSFRVTMAGCGEGLCFRIQWPLLAIGSLWPHLTIFVSWYAVLWPHRITGNRALRMPLIWCLSFATLIALHDPTIPIEFTLVFAYCSGYSFKKPEKHQSVPSVCLQCSELDHVPERAGMPSGNLRKPLLCFLLQVLGTW